MKQPRPRHALLALALTAALPNAHACGSEAYISQVCLMASNFCPRGTAEAAGQLLAISQNTALFSLLGTTYGGDGRVTFALPDLRGRVPVGVGQGPGLSSIVDGQVAGAETASLTPAQMPAHTHGATLRGTASAGTTDSPAGAVPAKLARSNIYSGSVADSAMGATAITIATAGGSQPVNLRNPYLGMRYCIVMEGIFPSRN